jgi:hypothetical protein
MHGGKYLKYVQVFKVTPYYEVVKCHNDISAVF